MDKTKAINEEKRTTERKRFSLLKRLRRSEDGATMVEFALIAPAFFLLLTGLLEMSIMFFTTTAVDMAMMDAARMVRTGQAQTAGNAVTTFRNTLCDSISSVYDCDNLSMDVRSFGNFGSMNFVIQEDADGNPVYVFNAGGASDYVLVRVIYDFQFHVPMVGNLLGGDNNAIHLTSAAIFRTEPYE